MSKIYSKLTIEKNSCSQNFDFLSLKHLSPDLLLGSSNSGRYHWILKLLATTWKSEVWKQNYVWLSYYFNFERNYVVLKSKSPCILLNKNINLKTKRNRKWKIHTVLERRTLCFSSYRNCKLKVKVWWVGARERKKKASLVPFILPEGNFFIICVLSQCI